jgi:hypothetical protein
VRPRLIVNFSDVNFGRGQPLQGICYIRRPYAPRRAIAQFHNVALLVLCDSHQYLPLFNFFVARDYGIFISNGGDATRDRWDINTSR